jgi:hypothetical protein
MNDPRVRKDGKCVCGKARKQKLGLSGIAGVLAGAIEKELAADPFCSTECCRKHHGCELPKKTVGRHADEYTEEAA